MNEDSFEIYQKTGKYPKLILYTKEKESKKKKLPIEDVLLWNKMSFHKYWMQKRYLYFRIQVWIRKRKEAIKYLTDEMLKWGKESNAYMTHICRHCLSRHHDDSGHESGRHRSLSFISTYFDVINRWIRVHAQKSVTFCLVRQHSAVTEIAERTRRLPWLCTT
jgi:hypothetical protein